MERKRRTFIAFVLAVPGVAALINACGGGGSTSDADQQLLSDQQPDPVGENGGNNGGGGPNGNGNNGSTNGTNGNYGAGLTDPKPMIGSPGSERVFVSQSSGNYGSYAAKSGGKGAAKTRMSLKDFERLT